MIKKTFFTAILATSIFSFGSVEAADNAALKKEMQLLDAAYKNLVNAVVLNDAASIEEPFHEVHAAKAATEKALENGEIKLPKNTSKIKLFKELDESFHLEIESLLDAAKAKNEIKIRDSAKRLLDGCVKCHSIFRK
ncbi:MAG: hypothetical protein OEV59_07685 [Deltaproteobacteria bacterium]|nr:hypothetical protein [Deltaproteobacteria bacterium]